MLALLSEFPSPSAPVILLRSQTTVVGRSLCLLCSARMSCHFILGSVHCISSHSQVGSAVSAGHVLSYISMTTSTAFTRGIHTSALPGRLFIRIVIQGEEAVDVPWRYSYIHELAGWATNVLLWEGYWKDLVQPKNVAGAVQ